MPMKTLTFSEVVRIRGVNPFIFVNPALARELRPGWRRPLPVLLRVNKKPADAWRTNMMPAGDGSFYLYLNAIVRAAAGVCVGDHVHVEIQFDGEYRNGPQHLMPPWFKEALKGNLPAQKNWGALIPSRKKEVLRYFAQLKSRDARARNATKAVYVLSGKTGRFMGRTWTKGA